MRASDPVLGSSSEISAVGGEEGSVWEGCSTEDVDGDEEGRLVAGSGIVGIGGSDEDDAGVGVSGSVGNGSPVGSAGGVSAADGSADVDGASAGGVSTVVGGISAVGCG
jgi:hypothetical protein